MSAIPAMDDASKPKASKTKHYLSPSHVQAMHRSKSTPEQVGSTLAWLSLGWARAWLGSRLAGLALGWAAGLALGALVLARACLGCRAVRFRKIPLSFCNNPNLTSFSSAKSVALRSPTQPSSAKVSPSPRPSPPSSPPPNPSSSRSVLSTRRPTPTTTRPSGGDAASETRNV